jgi:pSer/pThr/pTyr-binding forkhead associated (FHA) protein
MAKLVMVAPPKARVFPLDKPVIRIGRDPESEVHLASSEVSRAHARIFAIGSDLFLEDLGSTNGTRVNGEKVTQHRMQAGEELEIGPYRLRFDLDSAATIEKPDQPPAPARSESGARSG